MKASIRAMRVNAGLTQDDVYKAIGVGRNVYIDIEKGRRPITEEQRDKFCELTGCKPKDLDCSVLILSKA